MSFATDFNATTVAANGVRVSQVRGRPVHPQTPDLSDDTPIRHADGTPFIVKTTGARLTFGDIPVERRWAVDKDGKALEQREFEDRHMEWYILHFRARDKSPDDPTSRPVPRVEVFLSEGLAPDGVHYQTVGYDPHREPAGPLVRPDFKVNDTRELSGFERVRETEAEQRAAAAEERVAQLEKRMEALAAGVEAKPTPRTTKPTEEAPCGKSVSKGRVKAHMRFCKNPECSPPDEAA